MYEEKKAKNIQTLKLTSLFSFLAVLQKALVYLQSSHRTTVITCNSWYLV